VRSLQGEFSTRNPPLVEQLIELRMLVEATLDFPDEEIDFLESADAFGRLERIAAIAWPNFRPCTTGASAAGRGARRAGRAAQRRQVSLLNRLAGDELAIVTPVAGTTRDALRGTLQIEGIPLHIIDTAGLRETDDEVEKIGIARSWVAANCRLAPNR
jgi:tRNA modification GTPase